MSICVLILKSLSIQNHTASSSPSPAGIIEKRSTTITTTMASKNSANNSLTQLQSSSSQKSPQHQVSPSAKKIAQQIVNPSSNSNTAKNSKRERFFNRSLVIFKNGARSYAGSKECFVLLSGEQCGKGIFCEFLHNGSADHQKRKVCHRWVGGCC